MKKCQSSSRVVIAALVTLLAAANAFGATLHVAMSGDDAAAGTPEAPLRTIQKAVGMARAGDTVVVHGGEYKGHVIFQRSGEPDKPIILKAAPGERPVFDGEGKGRIELKSGQGWQKPIGWIRVEGLEIRLLQELGHTPSRGCAGNRLCRCRRRACDSQQPVLRTGPTVNRQIRVGRCDRQYRGKRPAVCRSGTSQFPPSAAISRP
jgi:hypothetical protein